jgi:hypothetical protein
MLISVMHREPKVTGKADQIGNARNAIEKMTADLREGESLTAATAYDVVVNKPCGANEGNGTCSVGYSCGPEAGATTWQCSREVPGGSRETIVSGLAPGDEVFCFYPNAQGTECSGTVEVNGAPTYVGITLKFPQENVEEHDTVFQGGVALHNAIIGNELIAAGGGA